MTGLMFLKEQMLIELANPNSVMFVTLSIFKTGFKFQMYVCIGFHDLLVMSANLDDIAILDINGVDYPCIISGISKRKTGKLLENADLIEKSGKLKNINFLTVYQNE